MTTALAAWNGTTTQADWEWDYYTGSLGMGLLHRQIGNGTEVYTFHGVGTGLLHRQTGNGTATPADWEWD